MSIALVIIAALAAIGFIVVAVRNKKAGGSSTNVSANISKGKTKAWLLGLGLVAVFSLVIAIMCGCNSPGVQKKMDSLKNTEVDLTYASQITGSVNK